MLSTITCHHIFYDVFIKGVDKIHTNDLASPLRLLSPETMVLPSPTSSLFSNMICSVTFDKCHRWNHYYQVFTSLAELLTHWDQVTHICITKEANVGSDNGLVPVWHQATIWTNVGLLIYWLLGNMYEIWIWIKQEKWISKSRQRNGSHFVSASLC